MDKLGSRAEERRVCLDSIWIVRRAAIQLPIGHVRNDLKFVLPRPEMQVSQALSMQLRLFEDDCQATEMRLSEILQT